MKHMLTAVLGVVLVVLVVPPGPMLAQKGKAASPQAETELEAQFRDSQGDKIYSDGGGPYYTVREPDRTYSSVVMLNSDGRLNMRVVKNRRVFLNFDTPIRRVWPSTNGQLTCHDYGGETVFYVDPPSFLAGVPENDSIYISTFGKITDNGSQWVYDPSVPFDFRTMAVHPTESALVRIQINFYTAADAGMFGVMPSYQLWSADVPLAGGVANVTHPSADAWVIESRFPDNAAVPPFLLGPNEAGFKITAPEVKRVHPGGNCDLGDWVMPFGLTLTKR
jgi:hypothetical protein